MTNREYARDESAQARRSAASAPLLAVENLRVEFATRRGRVQAVRGITYEVSRGETVALVGESGSGKSVSALALVGLLPADRARVAGRITFDGIEVLAASPSERRRLRGARIGMVFQDPLSALNPLLSIGQQLGAVVELHTGRSRKSALKRSVELLELVEIQDAQRRLRQYPHELSGGMRQRVMIAAALAGEPELLIADEPTTALDVTVQAQILEVLRTLQRETNIATLIITHDLGVVAGIAERVYVMYAGRIVEESETDVLLASPQHPYTKGLLRAVPRLDRPREARLEPIEGMPPDLSSDPVGCAFHPRCAFVLDRCFVDRPELFSVARGGASACWLVVEEERRS